MDFGLPILDFGLKKNSEGDFRLWVHGSRGANPKSEIQNPK
jgi:hypothetical protein